MEKKNGYLPKNLVLWYIHTYIYYLFNKSSLLEVEFLAFCITMFKASVLIGAVYIDLRLLSLYLKVNYFYLVNISSLEITGIGYELIRLEEKTWMLLLFTSKNSSCGSKGKQNCRHCVFLWHF